MPLRAERLNETVAQLAARPGHEAVRVGVTVLLREGLGAELADIRHEVRVVEARGRIDALLGRTAARRRGAGSRACSRVVSSAPATSTR